MEIERERERVAEGRSIDKNVRQWLNIVRFGHTKNAITHAHTSFGCTLKVVPMSYDEFATRQLLVA